MIVKDEIHFVVWPCASCGVRFAVPEDWANARRKDGEQIYCPNGHTMSFRETEADRLRRERDRLKQNAAHLEERISSLASQRDAAERRVAAARGQVTRLKNRAAAGVCPCCNRTFTNLARHMSHKHPDFRDEPIAGDNVVTLKTA